jgi:hypothetical protein
MANTYYTFDPYFIPNTKVRSDEVNAQLAAIENAFDLMPTDNSAIGRGTVTTGVESGTGNAYEVSLDDPRTSYQEGDQIVFKSTHTNTGTATLDLDTVGAVSLVQADGTPLSAGDIQDGLYYTAVYDAANNRWQLIGASAAVISAANDRVTWAQEWAIKAEDSLVSTDAGGNGTTDYSALHWAAKSAASAVLSSGYASDALASEGAAAASEAACIAIEAGISLPSFAGNSLKVIRVNAGETAWEAWTIPAATTSVSGLVELATDAETNTGTDTDRAVTPAGLLYTWNAKFSSSFTTEFNAAFASAFDTRWASTYPSAWETSFDAYFPNVTSSTSVTHTELSYLDLTTLGTAQASKVLTLNASGDLNMANVGRIDNCETVQFNSQYDNGTKTSSFSINLDTAQNQKVTLTANTMTITLTKPTSVGTWRIQIVNGGLATKTWAASSGSLYWAGKYKPALTSSGIDLLSVYCDGTNMFLSLSTDYGTA